MEASGQARKGGKRQGEGSLDHLLHRRRGGRKGGGRKTAQSLREGEFKAATRGSKKDSSDWFSTVPALRDHREGSDL